MRAASISIPRIGRFVPGVLAYLQCEHRRDRRIALATASDRRIADAVAAHLGLFGDVLASDGIINLKGRTKASALSRRFGARGYVYAGDSRADIPVWQAAAAGVVVGNSERLAARVARVAPIECRLAAEASPTLPMLLRLARPHQWVKSLLLLVPLMTAHRLGDVAAALAEVRAIVAVCLASSAIYVVNDLVDMAADRAHPTKRNRPIACGAISPLLAVQFAACLAAAAVVVARPLPHEFMVLLDVYFAGTIAYSVWRGERLAGEHETVPGRTRGQDREIADSRPDVDDPPVAADRRAMHFVIAVEARFLRHPQIHRIATRERRSATKAHDAPAAPNGERPCDGKRRLDAPGERQQRSRVIAERTQRRGGRTGDRPPKSFAPSGTRPPATRTIRRSDPAAAATRRACRSLRRCLPRARRCDPPCGHLKTGARSARPSCPVTAP